MGNVAEWHNLAPSGGKGCSNLFPAIGFGKVCGSAHPEIEGETRVLVETLAQVLAPQGPGRVLKCPIVPEWDWRLPPPGRTRAVGLKARMGPDCG